MRVVFYGICDLSYETAKKFIDEGHDVIIIDPDKDKVQELNEELDCSFLIGEASHPKVLKEVNPKETDLFFALSENSQNNIVSCLVARSLGIERTILRISDPDYEEMCRELNLREIVMPAQITSQYLFDSVLNENLLEMFEFIKDKACLFRIVATEKEVGTVENLGLSTNVKAVCYFRDSRFYPVDDQTKFEEKDEIILLTDRDHLKELQDRWKGDSE